MIFYVAGKFQEKDRVRALMTALVERGRTVPATMKMDRVTWYATEKKFLNQLKGGHLTAVSS